MTTINYGLWFAGNILLYFCWYHVSNVVKEPEVEMVVGSPTDISEQIEQAMEPNWQLRTANAVPCTDRSRWCELEEKELVHADFELRMECLVANSSIHCVNVDVLSTDMEQRAVL